MKKTKYLLSVFLCSFLFLIGSSHSKAAVKINMKTSMEANEKITVTPTGDYKDSIFVWQIEDGSFYGDAMDNVYRIPGSKGYFSSDIGQVMPSYTINAWHASGESLLTRSTNNGKKFTIDRFEGNFRKDKKINIRCYEFKKRISNGKVSYVKSSYARKSLIIRYPKRLLIDNNDCFTDNLIIDTSKTKVGDSRFVYRSIGNTKKSNPKYKWSVSLGKAPAAHSKTLSVKSYLQSQKLKKNKKEILSIEYYQNKKSVCLDTKISEIKKQIPKNKNAKVFLRCTEYVKSGKKYVKNATVVKLLYLYPKVVPEARPWR